MTKGVAIVSGGLDSITMLYHLLDAAHQRGETRKPDLHLLSFNYGQRHSKELEFAKIHAERFDLQHDIVDLTGITHLISNSALTTASKEAWEATGWDSGSAGHIEVPEGHYAEENMKATVVPNRNMIMLSIAVGVAVNEGADFVATGVHSGDHFIYPDCRPAFIEAANRAAVIGNEGFGKVPTQGKLAIAFPEFIQAPFLHWDKADIAYRALQLLVPLHLTWSCYKGGDKHCGKCGTCVERLEAIDIAKERYVSNTGLGDFDELDRTQYEDTEFWKQAVNA